MGGGPPSGAGPGEAQGGRAPRPPCPARPFPALQLALYPPLEEMLGGGGVGGSPPHLEHRPACEGCSVNRLSAQQSERVDEWPCRLSSTGMPLQPPGPAGSARALCVQSRGCCRISSRSLRSEPGLRSWPGSWPPAAFAGLRPAPRCSGLLEAGTRDPPPTWPV